MDYTSQERIESKVMPGIFFTLVKMVEGHRLELRRRAAAISAKISPLARRIEAGDQELKKIAATNDPAIAAKVAELQQKINEMVEQADMIHQTELEPIWIRWGLLKVEGDITINGEPPTADNLAFGPPDLYLEVLNLIRERLGISPAAIKNSSSPTTSIAQEDGTTGDTTADSAKTPETGSTPQETALVTTQAA